MKNSLSVHRLVPVVFLTLLAAVLTAVAAEWREVGCVPADPRLEDAFEVVAGLADFEGGTGGWRAPDGGRNAKASVLRDPAEHHGGAAALRVDYAEQFLRHAAERKMRPFLIYDYANPLYDDGGFPNSPEAIAAFSRYAVELMRLTRRRVAAGSGQGVLV